jgi:phthalate 4,5-dioxygenase oxygenase subunit
MLSQRDNDILTQVGPDTPMGGFMRLHWIPFLPSTDIVADDRPTLVRLLGEDLVVFRDSKGVLGLVDSLCPHRLAPLVYSRNEECGLRCVYHGWKFDVNGKVVDIPSEPNKQVVERMRIKSYRVQERNGLVWAYLGHDQENPPALPNFEWNLLTEPQVHYSFRVQETNWLQALEGDIDSAHASFLHTRIDGKGVMGQLVFLEDACPKFDVVREPFGVNIGAIRQKKNGDQFVRVNQFAMPFYTHTGGGAQKDFAELAAHAWVPIDDNLTMAIMASWHPTKPLNPRAIELYKNGYKGLEPGHASSAGYVEKSAMTPFSRYWTKYTAENDFLFDYEKQKTSHFSGVAGLWPQDVACQVGSSPIADRTREHLLSSDAGIVQTRRVLLDSVKRHQTNGELPATVTDPDSCMIRPVSLTLAPGEDWKDVRPTFLRARLGTDLGYELA